MFQPRQASNSVFTFQSSTIDANQTISEDPAIKERGPARHFKDTFSLMTLIYFEAKNNLYLLTYLLIK